jgi:DNA primase
MQYYFDKIFVAYNIEESEGKREAARKILPIIGRLPDRIEQDHWLQKLAGKLGVGETALRETLSAYRNKEKPRQMPAVAASAEVATRRETREEKISQSLLALIVKFPSFFDYIANRLSLEHFFGADNKAFYRNLIIYYNDNISQAENGRAEINYAEFRSWLASQNDGQGNEGLFRLLEKIAILGDKDYYDLEADKAKNEIIKMVIALKESYLSARKKEISRLIEELEKNGESVEAGKLMEELKFLSDETAANIEELDAQNA